MRLSIDAYVNNCLAGVPGYTPASEAGFRLAEDIHHFIIEGHGVNQFTAWNYGIPAIVLVDELRMADDSAPNTFRVVFKDIIDWCATLLRDAVLSQVSGRWGVLVQHCTNVFGYDSIESSLSLTHQAGGYPVYEMYPQRNSYCNNNHDGWLSAYYRGNPSGTMSKLGFQWFYNKYPSFRPGMRIVLGVQDSTVLQCSQTGLEARVTRYMDRMFYVWKTLYPDIIQPSWGGAGSHKWNAATVSVNTRDAAFASIWNNYMSTNGPNYTVICGCT
jgi:hypothetical protein